MMHELGTPEGRQQDFTAAMYQFLLPTITISAADGAYKRLPGVPFLHQVDENILSSLDAPYQELPTPIRARSHLGMCKNIGQVQRPPLPTTPSIHAPVQPKPTIKLEPKPSGSTARRKRTRKTKESDGRDDSQPTKKRKKSSKTQHFNKLKSMRKY